MMENENTLTILESTKQSLSKYGFEVYPFKVAWYNELVEEPFRLCANGEQSVLLIVSTPSMFDRSFLPYLKSRKCEQDENISDPIDCCVKKIISESTASFAPYISDVIYDFEMNHGRRPKLLMQTAGHVSGAAYYYRPSQVFSVDGAVSKPDVIKHWYGCCLHPRYGGWFAFRAALILSCPWPNSLLKQEPVDVFNGDVASIYNFLSAFNNNWRDNIWRDCSGAIEKYSDLQNTYFLTLPASRLKLVSDWFAN